MALGFLVQIRDERLQDLQELLPSLALRICKPSPPSYQPGPAPARARKSARPVSRTRPVVSASSGTARSNPLARPPRHPAMSPYQMGCCRVNTRSRLRDVGLHLHACPAPQDRVCVYHRPTLLGLDKDSLRVRRIHLGRFERFMPWGVVQVRARVQHRAPHCCPHLTLLASAENRLGKGLHMPR